MNITVNGEATEHTGSIADLLRDRLDDPRPRGIAVAVDGEVVSRDAWERKLTAGAVVEIVTAVQGG